MFINAKLHNRVNMVQRINQAPVAPPAQQPVVQVLKPTARGVMKPMIRVSNSHRKGGCKSCGSA